MRRTLLVLALGVLGLGAVGCDKNFTYFDVDVSFAGFTGVSTTSTIQTCHVFVTGADTTDFYVVDECPPDATDPSHMGTFEYSTLADSGKLNFEMRVFNGIPEGPSCQVGDGSLTVDIGSTTTNMEKLTVTAAGTGCHP